MGRVGGSLRAAGGHATTQTDLARRGPRMEPMNDRAQQPALEHGQTHARAAHSRRRGRSRSGRSRPDEEVEKKGVECSARVTSSVVFVSELGRSVEFYRDIFSCEVTIESPGASLLLA